MSSIAIKAAPLIELRGRFGSAPRRVLSTLVALALGLGVNSAIFTLGYLECMALYPHPDELVVLRSGVHGHDGGVSTSDFVQGRQKTTGLLKSRRRP